MKRALRTFRRKANQLLGRDLNYRIDLRRPTLRLGSEYGGWVIQPDLITRDAIIYCFGVGEDISFDLALIQRFGVTVHAFDPTPKSNRWIASQTLAPRPPLPPQFKFHNIGLADYDGSARFVLPRADFASYHMTAGNAAEHGADAAECPVHRLTTIMRDLGHARIDVLKMDIEGAEYAALPDIINARVPITQLLVEFHHTPGDRASLDRSRTAIDSLRNAGYRIFAIAPGGLEYSFSKVD